MELTVKQRKLLDRYPKFNRKYLNLTSTFWQRARLFLRWAFGYRGATMKKWTAQTYTLLLKIGWKHHVCRVCGVAFLSRKRKMNTCPARACYMDFHIFKDNKAKGSDNDKAR